MHQFQVIIGHIGQMLASTTQNQLGSHPGKLAGVQTDIDRRSVDIVIGEICFLTVFRHMMLLARVAVSSVRPDCELRWPLGENMLSFEVFRLCPDFLI